MVFGSTKLCRVKELWVVILFVCVTVLGGRNALAGEGNGSEKVVGVGGALVGINAGEKVGGGAIELLVVDEKGRPMAGVALGKRWIVGMKSKKMGYPKMVGEKRGEEVRSGVNGKAQVSMYQVFGKRGKRAVLIGVSENYGKMGGADYRKK